MKTELELKELLDKLISRWEDEVVEFKQGGAGFFTHDIGKYFSAQFNDTKPHGSIGKHHA